MSSTRFRNSGLKCSRSTRITLSRAMSKSCSVFSASVARNPAPRFDVMISTVFLKSTVRPFESVSRPSSMI